MFNGTSVSLVNLGIRSAEEISHELSESDAMLCVRGRLFPRRGSALAGIACGVPVIAYAGPAQQTPIAEAGIEFVPYGDRDALTSALVRVLTDEKLQSELRAKNRRSQERHFSWNRIARRHVEALASGT
jgi:glycosyltransferase involved in cell wall biosynthesis